MEFRLFLAALDQIYIRAAAYINLKGLHLFAVCRGMESGSVKTLKHVMWVKNNRIKGMC